MCSLYAIECVSYHFLALLQRHTMYQVGLMESDTHVQLFWNALESFSQVSERMRVAGIQQDNFFPVVG